MLFAFIRLLCRSLLKQTCCHQNWQQHFVGKLGSIPSFSSWKLPYGLEPCFLGFLWFWPPRLSTLNSSFCQAALVFVHTRRLYEHSVCILQPLSSFAACFQSLIVHSGYLASSLHKACGRQANTFSWNHSANRLWIYCQTAWWGRDNSASWWVWGLWQRQLQWVIQEHWRLRAHPEDLRRLLSKHLTYQRDMNAHTAFLYINFADWVGLAFATWVVCLSRMLVMEV